MVPGDEIIFAVGFDSHVRKTQICLFSISCLLSANRQSGLECRPWISWVGKENREYFAAVSAACNFSHELALCQGKLIKVGAMQWRIRFASPPNFSHRQPQGHPCPWCDITHAELTAWDITIAWRIAIHNKVWLLVGSHSPHVENTRLFSTWGEKHHLGVVARFSEHNHTLTFRADCHAIATGPS